MWNSAALLLPTTSTGICAFGLAQLVSVCVPGSAQLVCCGCGVTCQLFIFIVLEVPRGDAVLAAAIRAAHARSKASPWGKPNSNSN